MEEKKNRNIYVKRSKIVVLVVQMICVILFAICAVIAGSLIYSTGSVEDLLSQKSYEESERCITHVSNSIAVLDEYMQLKDIFETSGSYDEEQTLDILNPEIKKEDKKNIETTYKLKDLREMSESGALEQLRFVLENAYYDAETMVSPDVTVVQEELYSDEFSILYNSGRDWETKLPVSGIMLADYALGDPTVSLRDMYKALCSTGEKLQKYINAGNKLKQNTNFHYYIKDIKKDIVYTNGEWERGIEKVWSEASQWKLAVRYIRTPEHIKFDEDSRGSLNWLGNLVRTTEFTGNREEVIVALDTNYLAEDVFKNESTAYEKAKPLLLPSIIVGIISLVGGIICFFIATVQTGRKKKGGDVQLTKFERIPTEVAAAIVCCIGLMMMALMLYILGGPLNYVRMVVLVFWILVGAALFMWAYLSLVRRIKAKVLWKNSICRILVDIGRKVYSARTTSGKLILACLLFFFGHIVLIGIFQIFGVFIAIILDLLILLYLLKDVAGRQTVRMGLSNIAAGDLEYKIDLSNLQGDNLEMAETVNRVGEGLQTAVEKSMKDERMRSELITNVSHDIKTPLTSIINYVDLLKREDIKNPKIKNYIAVLEMKSQRLKQLTEDLVEASKVSSGNIELHMEKIQVQELLQQAYGELEEKFSNRKLEIIFNNTGEPTFIWADGRQLWRIFENLLNNIAKYALANTRVYLDLRVINQRAVLTFKNISEQALNISADELTERFTRGDESRTTEGSGLGLSIAKSLTELQKGNFDIYLDGDLFKVTVAFDLLKSEV